MIYNLSGPFGIVPAWHVEAITSTPEGRRSVVLRTYLQIAIAVSGRRREDGWWLPGGVRGLADAIGADVKDTRSALALLERLGVLRRVRRRTLGDRGHHLASAYVWCLDAPPAVENPADGQIRGGQFAPHLGGGDGAPHQEGGTVPPTSGDVGDEVGDGSLSVGSPLVENVPGAVLPQGSSSTSTTARDGSWLSEEEEARIVVALGDLQATVDDGATARRAVAWSLARVGALRLAYGTTADLCPCCGDGHTPLPSERAASRCGACGASTGRYTRSDVVDASGRILGPFLRPSVVLAGVRRGRRHEVAAIDRLAGRLGLW